MTCIPSGTIDPAEAIEIGWAIEVVDTLPPDVTKSPVHLRVALESSYSREESARRKALGILRLISSNAIDLAFTSVEHDGIFLHHRALWFPVIQRKARLNHSTFGGGNEGTIARLWNRTTQSPNAGKVAVPLRRWNDSFDRFNNEDRLIDFWIALESLFAPEVDSEIKFRGALRVATFLGRNGTERQDIYNDMRHSYDWRSAIVHGSSGKKIKSLEKKASLKVTTEKTQDYLRRAILGILKLDIPFEAQRLDDLFFSG